jgi:hypothetical protein
LLGWGDTTLQSKIHWTVSEIYTLD